MREARPQASEQRRGVNQSPRISLCMIVKNEEAFIEECLRSVREAVDEVIVVDTGSTDATVELARRACAQVFHFKWCDDFSAARNDSIARATGDWVLWLDADERLAPGAAQVIREAAARDDLDCGYLFLHNASSADASTEEVLSGRARLAPPVLHPRLLRRTLDLRFSGVVHEQISDWLRPRLSAGKTANLAAHLIHLGYAPSLRKARDKGDRNIRLLQKRAAAAPRDYSTYGYLAQECLEQGNPSEAWEAIEAGWRLLERGDPTMREPALLLVCMRARLQMGSADAAGVLSSVEAGRRWVGPHPDLDIFEGVACLSLAVGSEGARRTQLLLQAARSYESALAKDDLAYSQGFLSGSRSDAAMVGLGLVQLTGGSPSQALGYFDSAFSRDPANREASLGRAEALAAVGQGQQALGAIEGWLDDEPDGWLIAAAAAEALGQIEDFKRFFLGAHARSSSGYSSPHRNEEQWAMQARLLAYLGQPKGSRGAFGGVCSLLAGTLPTSDVADLTKREEAWVRLLVDNLRRLGRLNAIDRLLQPESEQAVPGLRALVESAAVVTRR